MQNKINLFYFVLLLATSIYGANTLTEYRNNGIVNIEKKLDFALTKKKYWLSQLKDKDIRFGYLEKYSNVLSCNKEKATLKLFSYNKKKKFYLKKSSSVFVGKNRGDKENEGDLKTPIGAYRLVRKKEENLDPFYGPLALVTSYPNTYDRYLGKTGHGIWIHGVPENEKRDSYTKGCIALQNNELKDLDKQINIDNTLLLISEKKDNTKVSNKILATILSQLYTWRYAWLYNDLKLYLSFYSKKFIRRDGMNFRDFKHYKKRVFSRKGKKTIIFNNINVIPYPEKKGLYKLSFNEYYKSNIFEFKGRKVLIIKYHNNKIEILTEK